MIKLRFVIGSIITLSLSVGNLRASKIPDAKTLPTRIVSASITSDEILWELMKTSADRNRILAFSPLVDNITYSHISTEVRGVKKRFPVSAEGIVSLQGDLIILSSFNNPSYKRILEKIKTPFIELEKFTTLSDISKHITKIGMAIGKESEADILRKKFNDELKLLRNKMLSKKPSVLMYSISGNAMAGDTIFDDIVRHCGGLNLASEGGQKGWPQINTEAVLKMQPDYIVISHADERNFKASKIWQMLSAAKCNRVIKIPSATLWSSSQFVIGTVRAICQAIKRPIPSKC